MRVRIDKYTIDINEDDLRKSRRSSWINARVKSFAWMGISPEILSAKFAEIYDIVKGQENK